MTDESLDTDAAFSLLADETRVRILEELGSATASPETGIPRLSYADLKSRVGIRDSGRFNYHLTKLVGNYVAKEDEGYRLRWPGLVLYRTLVAGHLTDEAGSAVDRFAVGTDCHRCGDSIEAYRYETLFRVRCFSCEATYTDVYVPSHGLVDRDRTAILEAVHRRTRTILDSMTSGQCPWCAREVSPEIHEGDGSLPSLHDTRDLEPYVVYHCTDCTGFQYVPVSGVLLYHPATVAFYYDHGLDLTEIPAWELPWAVTDDATTVLETDPWRFRVRIDLADESFVAHLDEDLEVVDAAREPRIDE
ncbi:winged helix-turn-helix domain-containing protein [Natrarchaeobius chitinivorans]|uniref:ArsR family transcriptional regulator n=1 Tax=Natrarchaeobius chitinivorans TaxID=1679083 RepID=A0A3N6PG44_NATCH|nr:helix-turn-helix domain-containing protein [Natrarchaeobius chitinivorans]RQG96655.1 ArsR family transcriptional regulator [Natrarchaeobius chitinivorans]